MSTVAVACPTCRSTLRSNRPVPAGRMVRCPDCGTHFTVTADLAATPDLEQSSRRSPAGARSSRAAVLSPSSLPALGTARTPPGPRIPGPVLPWPVVGAILVGCGLIAGALLIVTYSAPQAHNPPLAQAEESGDSNTSKTPSTTESPSKAPAKDPAGSPDREAEQLLAEERQKLQEQREQIERERRQIEAARLLAQGERALANKDLEAAEQAFTEALKLAPEDKAINKGLADVKAARQQAQKNQEEEANRKGRLDELRANARKALEDKQFLAAQRALEEALELAPGDEDLRKDLAAAQKAVAADKLEKKKQADYQAAMEEGNAHLKAGRLAEAVKAFQAAQKILPDDLAAARGQRTAEARLAEEANRGKREGAFLAALDRSKKALAAKRLTEALDEAAAALAIFPDDERARQQIRKVNTAQKQARAEYLQIMAQGDAALKLGRFEEAIKLFGDASRLFPEEKEPAQKIADAERGLENSRLALEAYQRFVEQALIAEESGRFADAARFWGEALRVNPGDVQATQRLAASQAAMNATLRRGAEYDRAIKAGTAALASNQFAEAVRAFRLALRLAPNDPVARSGLDRALFGQLIEEGKAALLRGNKNEAIRAFEKALRLKPGDPTATGFLRQAQFLRAK